MTFLTLTPKQITPKIDNRSRHINKTESQLSIDNRQCLESNGLECSMKYFEDGSIMMSLNFRYARDISIEISIYKINKCANAMGKVVSFK